MVQTLVGTNSFLRSKALTDLRREFIATYGDMAVENIDAETWEVARLLDVLSAQPFLTPKRLVVLTGLAANKTASEQCEKLLDAVSDVTQLVIVESKLDKRGLLYKTLKKKTDFKEFTDLDARSLPAWLVAEAKQKMAQLSIADASYLVQRVGTNQELLASEIEKLRLYNLHITRASIDALTEQAPLSSIFDLIEAAFRGDVQKAVYLYNDQRAQNVEPLAIEALFVWQLHTVLLMKSASSTSSDTIAAEAGISPYTAKKSAELASRRTLGQLKAYAIRLAETEYAMKSRAIDADEAMKNYIAMLSR